jgi:hypothetical protein
LFALAGMKSDFCRSFHLYRYFLWATLTSAHAFASPYFVSVIEHFKWAKDLGKAPSPIPVAISEELHSVSAGLVRCQLGSLVGLLIPRHPFRAGHHQSSIVIAGSLWRRVAMCSLASRACTWPGLGSSEVIRRTAAWASANIVTRPRTRRLRAAVSSARAILARVSPDG